MVIVAHLHQPQLDRFWVWLDSSVTVIRSDFHIGSNNIGYFEIEAILNISHKYGY